MDPVIISRIGLIIFFAGFFIRFLPFIIKRLNIDLFFRISTGVVMFGLGMQFGALFMTL